MAGRSALAPGMTVALPSDMMHRLQERRAQPRVLVVDDLLVNRLIASAILEAEGLRCDQAASAADAIDLLDRRHYELLLLDLDLGPRSPGGLELLERLQSERRGDLPRTVVVTGNPDAEGECMDRGASDYLIRPFDPGVLSDRVSRALARRAAGPGCQCRHCRADAALVLAALPPDHRETD